MIQQITNELNYVVNRYGFAKALSKTSIEKTIHNMIILDILTEITQQSERYGTINTVIAVNHKVSNKLLQGSLQVEIIAIYHAGSSSILLFFYF